MSILKKYIDKLQSRKYLQKDRNSITVDDITIDFPLVFDGNPTAERLAKAIYDRAVAMGLRVSRVDFWETQNCRATYSRRDAERDDAPDKRG